MRDLITSLRSGKVLLMDGAMGTELRRLTNAPVIECGEAINRSNPALIRTIHRAYLDAGADVLLTNTFQANPDALARRGLGAHLHNIWNAAIGLAHLDHPRPRLVLADVGPIEKLTPETTCAILAECIGVDGVLLETWSSLDALKRFVDRPLPAGLPLLVSFTFHRTSDLMTFTGARPEQCAQAAKQYGAAALGANCGKEIGMTDLLEVVQRYRTACELPIFVRPNAGSPDKTGWRYPRTPETMASALVPLLEAGISMVGGCCGTTPEHICAFRKVVDVWNGANDSD
jgi:5-methyltetrahydrofolate--homocysteine methyltransferase